MQKLVTKRKLSAFEHVVIGWVYLAEAELDGGFYVLEGGGFVAIEGVTIGPRIEYFAHIGVEGEGGFEVGHSFCAAFHTLVEPAPIEVGGEHVGILRYC